MRKYLIPALAALALSGAASAKVPVTVSERVSISDLDLTTAEGSARLNSRIHAAAEKVCERVSLRDLRSASAFNACKGTAIAGAMEQVAALKLANGVFAGR